MMDLIKTINKHDEVRWDWKCLDCRAQAGRWPQRETAEKSAARHERICKVTKALKAREAEETKMAKAREEGKERAAKKAKVKS